MCDFSLLQTVNSFRSFYVELIIDIGCGKLLLYVNNINNMLAVEYYKLSMIKHCWWWCKWD